MDHDAMNRDVQGLKKFRQEAEEAIAFYKGIKAAGGKIPAADGGGETASGVSAEDFAQFKSDTDDRLTKIEQNFTDWAGRLDQLSNAPQAAAGVQVDQGVLDRMEAMLTWFEGNKEGMEILLSLDGEVDTDTSGVTGTTVPGSILDTGAGTGLGGSQAGADAPNPQTGTDTGPGSVDGLPGISQDPSADASIATDQPAAKVD